MRLWGWDYFLDRHKLVVSAYSSNEGQVRLHFITDVKESKFNNKAKSM